MSDMEYLKMLEVPVNSCDVVLKPSKRKKKNVVEEVIDKVNNPSEPKPKRRAPKIKNASKAVKHITATNKESETVSIKSSKFDIISVQVVAIFTLIVGIILTNIFWEDSGMNNLMRQVFGTTASKNTATYSSFSPLSPSKTEDVLLQDGVMTISSGSVYSPCNGVVENVSENDGLYTVTIKHSDSFSTVISGLELCYLSKNENVFQNVPVGYSSSEINVSMFDNNTTITSYIISENEILWLT
ncbi:MAG: hypothetical protein J6Q58_06020 [Clostridia bacterium]|nr:hypothetical protein [Clostridia bacterium]